MDEMEYKGNKITPMDNFSSHKWNISYYQHKGINYILTSTFLTEKEALEQKRKMNELSKDLVVVMPELSDNRIVFRVYSSWYNSKDINDLITKLEN